MPEIRLPSDEKPIGEPIVPGPIKPPVKPLPARPVGALTRNWCPRCGWRMRRVCKWVGSTRKMVEKFVYCPACDQAYTRTPITTSVVDYAPVGVQRTLAGVVVLNAALAEAKALPAPSETMPILLNREVKIAAIEAALPAKEIEAEEVKP